MKTATSTACLILVLLLLLAGCVPIPPPTPAPAAPPTGATPEPLRGGQDPTETPEPECELEVVKDAFASRVEARRWTIAKTSQPISLTLEVGETAEVKYTVTIDADEPPVASAWLVTGSITVTNPSATAAVIADLVDVISPAPNIPAQVACEEKLPFELEAGETLLCEYAAELPDSSDRLNTVTVTAGAPDEAGRGSGPEPETQTCTATADVRFTEGEVIVIDECVKVSDNVGGKLGRVCAADQLPRVFTYTRTVGPFAVCGTQELTNTASYTTADTRASGTVTHTLTIDTPCDGCVDGHGYWKNHADKPDKYDSAWDMVGAGGPATPFYLSGKNWLDVLETSSNEGNAYYILAQQFAATKLNLWRGAPGTNEVNEAVAAAEAYFTAKPPEPEPADPQRAELIEIAGLLDEYNNGDVGPPKCD